MCFVCNCVIDGTASGNGGTFYIYLDDKLYKEYPISGDMLVKEVTIDVTGVQILNITISYTGPGRNAKYGFGNVTIE